MLMAGVLILAACGGGGTSGTGVSTTAGGDTRPDLSTADVQILRDAVAKANAAQSKEYVACVVADLQKAVRDGTLSATDVRDWSSGRDPLGPVQQHVTDPAVIAACVSVTSSTVRS